MTSIQKQMRPQMRKVTLQLQHLRSCIGSMRTLYVRRYPSSGACRLNGVVLLRVSSVFNVGGTVGIGSDVVFALSLLVFTLTFPSFSTTFSIETSPINGDERQDVVCNTRNEQHVLSIRNHVVLFIYHSFENGKEKLDVRDPLIGTLSDDILDTENKNLGFPLLQTIYRVTIKGAPGI